MEQLDLSYFTYRNVNWQNHFGKCLAVHMSKAKHLSTLWINNSTPRCKPKGKKYVNMSNESHAQECPWQLIIAKNSTTCMFFSRRMDKWIVIYSYNGILLSVKQGLQIHAATWMNLKILCWKKTSRHSTYYMGPFKWSLRTDKTNLFIEIKVVVYLGELLIEKRHEGTF